MKKTICYLLLSIHSADPLLKFIRSFRPLEPKPMSCWILPGRCWVPLTPGNGSWRCSHLPVYVPGLVYTAAGGPQEIHKLHNVTWVSPIDVLQRLHGVASMGDALLPMQPYSFRGSGLPASAREAIWDRLPWSPQCRHTLIRSDVITHELTWITSKLRDFLGWCREGLKQRSWSSWKKGETGKIPSLEYKNELFNVHLQPPGQTHRTVPWCSEQMLEMNWNSIPVLVGYRSVGPDHEALTHMSNPGASLWSQHFPSIYIILSFQMKAWYQTGVDNNSPPWGIDQVLMLMKVCYTNTVESCDVFG